MKKEIQIVFDEQFIKDLDSFQNSSELAQEVHKKAQLLKQFPLIGPQIAQGFRKIIFEYQFQQYIFSYKFLASESKIKIYRLKNSRQNTFHSEK